VTSPRVRFAVAVGTLAFLYALGLAPWAPTQPSPTLDGSWRLVTEWAGAHRLQWGTDLVFTTGPLAFLYTGAFDPVRWPWALAFSCWVSIGLAVLVVQRSRTLPWALRGLVASLVAVAVAALDPPNAMFLALPLFAVLALETPGRAAPFLAGSFAFASAAAGLAKASSLPIALATFVWADAGTWAERRHSGATSPRPSLTLIYVASAMLLLVASGQDLRHLGEFLAALGQSISGYTEAMVLEGPAHLVVLAALLLGATLALGIGGPNAPAAESSAVRWRRAGALALWALLTWKSSVVRQSSHLAIAGITVALCAAVVGARSSRRAVIGLLLGVAGLGLVPATLARRGETTWRFEAERRVTKAAAGVRAFARLAHSPAATLRRFAEQRDEALAVVAASSPVPRLDGTVDVLGHGQGAVIARGLDYHPRPSFQGYATFTAGLAERNRAFYLGDDAPKFVVPGSFETIDGRLPALTEGPLWPILLARYRVRPSSAGGAGGAGGEGGDVLVLERREVAREVTRTPLHRVEVVAGQPVDLPLAWGPRVWLSIDIERTPLGGLAALLYHLPPPRLQLTFDDGHAENYRAVRGLAKLGFVVSPALRNDPSIAAFWNGDDAATSDRRVTAVRWLVPDAAGGFYRERATFTFERLDYAPDRSDGASRSAPADPLSSRTPLPTPPTPTPSTS
jgi:hypothetical protein